jgi:hypothetical protein
MKVAVIFSKHFILWYLMMVLIKPKDVATCHSTDDIYFAIRRLTYQFLSQRDTESKNDFYPLKHDTV